MAKDLTTGKPYKTIISFGIPILIGNLLQQFYNIVDAAIVGRFVGIEALAGVASTASLNFLVMGFVMGTCTGFGIPMAKAFGAQDTAKLKKYFANAIYISIIISIILTVLTLVFIDDILVMMNTPENMMYHSKSYISTVFAGIAGMCLYNLLASALRSVGDSKTPLYFLIFSAFLNLVLDLIFVLGCGFGVFGAALATVISQTASGIMCIFLIFKKIEILKIGKSDWKINFKLIKDLFYMGLPMGLQFSITAIGSVVLQSAINSLGTIYAASIAAGNKISLFAVKVLDTLGLSIATFTGQNLGAGKIDRIRKGVNQGLIIGLIYSVFIFVVFYFTGDYLVLIFIDSVETQAIENASLFLLVNSSAYLVLTFLHIYRNAIQGAGYSAIAMLAGVMEMIARCSVAFGLVSTLGYFGAILANPVAWASAVLFLAPTYFVIMRKLKSKFPNQITEKI